MTDVKNSQNRWPDPQDKWEFPYAHIVWRSQDGSFFGFCEKNGKNTLFTFHGPSGSYTEINASGDVITASKGNRIDVNDSHHVSSTAGNSDTLTHGVSYAQTGGGKYEVVAGQSHTFNGDSTTTITVKDSNSATLGGSYQSVAQNSRTNVGGNTIETGGGTKTTTIDGNYSMDSSGGDISIGA